MSPVNTYHYLRFKMFAPKLSHENQIKLGVMSSNFWSILGLLCERTYHGMP